MENEKSRNEPEKKKAELLTVVFVYYTLIRTLPQNDAEAFRSWMKMCG